METGKLCGRVFGPPSPTAPLSPADLKSSVLNSTSDSDLVRHRAVGRVPQVSLSFGSDRTVPPSPTEIEIMAPSRMKDRTQNVTEKVTQVTQVRRSCVPLARVCSCLLTVSPCNMASVAPEEPAQQKARRNISHEFRMNLLQRAEESLFCPDSAFVGPKASLETRLTFRSRCLTLA